MKRTKTTRWLAAAASLMLVLSPTTALASFQDIEVSPRARALGGAFAALRLDAFIPFHNPAGLAWLDQRQGTLSASYVQPFGYDFSKQSVATGSLGLGRWGGVGVGFRHFGTDLRGESLNSETTLTASYGFRVIEDEQSSVSVGANVNVYSQSFGVSVGGTDPGSATTVGLDFGAQAVLYGRTRVGFYAVNLNDPTIGSIDHEELVPRVGVGVSYQPYRGVETVLDMAGELGEAIQFRGGMEFQVVSFLWLRAGIRTQPNIFSFGAGVSYHGFGFDYALSTGGGSLDYTNQFAVKYWFGSK